jgi:hypothetical protein
VSYNAPHNTVWRPEIRFHSGSESPGGRQGLCLTVAFRACTVQFGALDDGSDAAVKRTPEHDIEVESFLSPLVLIQSKNKIVAYNALDEFLVEAWRQATDVMLSKWMNTQTRDSLLRFAGLA